MYYLQPISWNEANSDPNCNYLICIIFSFPSHSIYLFFEKCNPSLVFSSCDLSWSVLFIIIFLWQIQNIFSPLRSDCDYCITCFLPRQIYSSCRYGVLFLRFVSKHFFMPIFFESWFSYSTTKVLSILFNLLHLWPPSPPQPHFVLFAGMPIDQHKYGCVSVAVYGCIFLSVQLNHPTNIKFIVSILSASVFFIVLFFFTINEQSIIRDSPCLQFWEQLHKHKRN